MRRWLACLSIALPLASLSCSVEATAAGASGGGGGDGALGGSAFAGSSEGGAPSSPCGETPNAPPFEIGTGETCFEPLAEGAVVPRVGGPQGGFHVWGAFLCADCPPKVIVNVGLKVPNSDAWLTDPSERVVEVLSAQVAGLIALLPGTPDNPSSSLPEGSEVRIVIELRTLAGEPLHAAEAAVVLGQILLWKP